jgi:hypothetical protein
MKPNTAACASAQLGFTPAPAAHRSPERWSVASPNPGLNLGVERPSKEICK